MVTLIRPPKQLSCRHADSEIYCRDPTNTAKWLAVYICLWYTQHLLGFVVSLSLVLIYELGLELMETVWICHLYGRQEPILSFVCRSLARVDAQSA